jgi:hypothetical protein
MMRTEFLEYGGRAYQDGALIKLPYGRYLIDSIEPRDPEVGIFYGGVTIETEEFGIVSVEDTDIDAMREEMEMDRRAEERETAFGRRREDFDYEDRPF